MSLRVLDELRAIYPGRYALHADEVALVIRGQNTRGVVQKVREGMKNGRYSGARKIDGTWQLPLSDLAEILDPVPDPPPLPRPSPPQAAKVGRRRSSIGPRLGFIRALDFWGRVFRSTGEIEASNELFDQARKAKEEGRLARDIQRSEEQARHLRASTGLPQKPFGDRGGI